MPAPDLCRLQELSHDRTLDSVFRLTLTIRPAPTRELPLAPALLPETESHYALPYHEFGLDDMALFGRLRYAEHRSIPKIDRELTGLRLDLAALTVLTSRTATMS